LEETLANIREAAADWLDVAQVRAEADAEAQLMEIDL
jgi:hypothetical protein